MSVRVTERTTHVASLVIRPVDALRAALQRPVFERVPVTPVRFRMTGSVAGGVVTGFPRRAPRALRNLSGDTVFRDLALPKGKYRIILERGLSGWPLDYHGLDAVLQDVDWDPTQPPPLPPGERPHRTHLHEVVLQPTSSYPFPPDLTLLRGTLCWYDGAPLAGAAVTCATALLPGARVDDSGGFVLCFAWHVTGPVTVKIDVTGVSANSRPDGAAYLGAWPAQWVGVPLRAGGSASVCQAALAGTVVGPGGQPLRDVEVEVLGRPGRARTDELGRWRYHFPPVTADQPVDLEFRHAAYAMHPLAANVRADATVTTPTVQLT